MHKQPALMTILFIKFVMPEDKTIIDREKLWKLKEELERSC